MKNLQMNRRLLWRRKGEWLHFDLFNDEIEIELIQEDITYKKQQVEAISLREDRRLPLEDRRIKLEEKRSEQEENGLQSDAMNARSSLEYWAQLISKIHDEIDEKKVFSRFFIARIYLYIFKHSFKLGSLKLT